MSGLTDIITALNTANADYLTQEITSSNVSFGTMESINAAVSTYNVRAVLSPVSSGGFTGAGTYVAWRRIDLTTLFKGIPVSIIDGTVATITDLIPLINEMYGYTIGTDDVVNATLPSPNTGQTATVTIKAASTSMKFVGSFSLTFSKS